jgi:potassium-transporting ATPase potassium-binding subunit
MLFVVIVTALVRPLGGYMERVFSRKRTVLDRFCLPVERLIYRITAVDPEAEMTGREDATGFVLFGLTGTLLLYAILRTQQFLPWFFPQYHTTPLSPDLALNTAISFSTTSTWQAYAGENTMSYFSQMVPHRDCREHQDGTVRALRQHRPAWFYGDSLRLHFLLR